MTHRHAGFTIIEVMLFLAISGALVTMLLVGVSASIQREQYRDATQSFAQFMRSQYDGVINVENNHNNNHPRKCPLISSTPPTYNGQSHCVIVGRYVHTARDSGDLYRSYPVYAAKIGGLWRYGVDAAAKEDYTVNWGVRTYVAGRDKERARISFLMYRHPDTGQVAVLSDSATYVPANIQAFVDKRPTDAREICLRNTGWIPDERRSLMVPQRAGSSDAFMLKKSGAGCND